jgi:TetR/AcrR family transcriptional regulator, cholesterol catabolism regulator
VNAPKNQQEDSSPNSAVAAPQAITLPNSAGGTEKSDSREEMENNLLGAAASLFRRKGFVGATTRELAKSLGLQRASLYHYLESKQDLLYVLSTRAMESISREVAASIEASPPDERLRNALRTHLEETLSEQEMHFVVLSESRHLEQERRDEVSRLHHSYHQQLRKLIREEQDAGRLRQDLDSKYLALMLSNLLNWTLFWYEPDGPLTPSEIADLIIELFINGAKAT